MDKRYGNQDYQKKPHFAVAQYPLDLKSKWKP